jgi:hypothetical protein
MNIKTAHGENDLAEFANRLFQLKGSKAKTARAVAALKRANPNLDATKPLAAGTPVLVPPIEGIKSPPTRAPAPPATLQAIDDARRALDQAGRTLAESFAEADREDRDMIELATKSIRTLSTLAEDAPSRLKKIAAAAEERLAVSAEAAKSAKVGLAGLRKELDELAKRL